MMFEPAVGSKEYYRRGCRALDRRITEVHCEGSMEKPALDPGEMIVTCFVTWRRFDVYWLRDRLNRRVWAWLESNCLPGTECELRFVENYPGVGPG